jgi:hypothetical protein
LNYAHKTPVKIQRANEKDDLNSRHGTTVSRRALVIHLYFPHPPLSSPVSKTPAFCHDLVSWLLGIAFIDKIYPIK